MYILKGGRSSDRAPEKRFTSWGNLPKGYEDSLLGTNGQPGKIMKGDLSDYDINFILQSGDKHLKAEFERKFKKEKSNAKHVQNLYGNAFDNVDNNGNPYKIMDTPVDLENPQYDAKKAEEMKNILKENL